MPSKSRLKWGIAAAALLIATAGGAVAMASNSSPKTESTSEKSDGPEKEKADQPISGRALDQAKAAALAHTGGGVVTETEVNDEESKYEVEVTKNGKQIDVQLDETFNFVSEKVEDAEK